MSETPDVALATEEDADRLAEVISAAFFDLEASHWLIPDPDWRRAAYARFFHLTYIAPGLRSGYVYRTADRMAASVWLPIGDPGTDHGPDPAYEQALEELTGPYHGNFVEFDRLLSEAHAPHVDTPHDFLGIIGAHPGIWGQGSARALMDAHVTKLDERQRPSYLEAANATLVGVWGKFGYERTERVITLPNGHQMYPMWREPRSTAR
ncbi:MAG: hypothetical protein AUI14_07260 [Actinobacteria bacterium 13_2_20CM_2_71_6]|nr:MAG: hypothetical protein AUI14_07260 [Actinobacteria bacterium 13_2_20CM_2_71_6]